MRGGYSSSWIRPATRVGIYLRDGLCCAYCMQDWSVQGLTIDHIVARSDGGGNEHTNLISACMRCNGTRRAAENWENFAAYLGISGSQLQRRIAEQAQPLTSHIRRRANCLVRDPPDWLKELRKLNTNWSPQYPLFPREQLPLRPDDTTSYGDEEIPF